VKCRRRKDVRRGEEKGKRESTKVGECEWRGVGKNHGREISGV
jgi:hypothetical protein